MVVVEVNGKSYYMNKKLKLLWDKIKSGKLAQKDDDRFYIVDGRERTGKSLFTLQQAAYIDPTILDDGPNGEPLPRITFTAEETLKAIRETKSTKEHTRVIIVDEAFRGMSSRGALSKENKMLAQAVQEMGQNNIVMFIVAPRFFMLELYLAVLRSHALFHIYKDKGSNRRYFKVYNEKKKGIMYQKGMRKGWAYNVPTKFRDTFFNIYPGGDEFEARYRAKKLKALQSMGAGNIGGVPEETKRLEQRDRIIAGIYKDFIKSERKLSAWLGTQEVPLSNVQVHLIAAKYAANHDKTLNA